MQGSGVACGCHETGDDAMLKDEGGAYVLGHSDRELARLERQAGFFADMTHDVFLRAGLKPGMKVLDLGCGVGDVSAIAADLVGPGGEVLGLDISPDAIGIAARRMKATGREHVRFQASTIEAFEGFADFDAVVGRFILVHMGDPAALIRGVAGKMKAGALLSFVEMDMSTATAMPDLPLLTRNIDYIRDVYRRAGRQMDMGAHLFAAYRAAGLHPHLIGFTRIGSGKEEAGFEFVADSVRSLLPFIEGLGIASSEEIGVDDLQHRLLAEAAGDDHCIFYPRLIGGWAAV
jgi:SAM-dependent methyltransferase